MRRLRLAGLALAWLVVLIAPAEAVLRIHAVQAALPAPNVGSSYEEGAKQVRLEWTLDRGPVDCFLVGSSVVVQGLDPAVFEQSVAEAGGPKLHCFNAAIRGATLRMTAQKIAKLNRLYHPRLFIYGINYRDLMFDPTVDMGDLTSASEPPPGPNAPADWLGTHSYLYEYASTVRWYLSASNAALGNRQHYETILDARGFMHEPGIWPHIERIPPPRTRYTTHPGALALLTRIAAMNGRGPTMILVEMPVPPSGIHLLGGADATFDKYVQSVQDAADSQGTLFVPTTRLKLIPEDGWADLIHLNQNGAHVFSMWLGHTLAGEISR